MAEPDFFKVLTEAIELSHEEIGDARIGGGEEHLPVAEQHQIPQNIEKGKYVEVIHMGDRIVKYLRAPLPLPPGGLTGNIRLSATFCYASPTDPLDIAADTRAGLEVVFRPNVGKKKEEKQSNANPRGFFDMKKYESEAERRSDRGKWETVLHGAKNMRSGGLNEPHFDIHYNAREAGASTATAKKIRYALIITVEAPRHADLYNEILRAYAKTLVPIVPQVALPIRLR